MFKSNAGPYVPIPFIPSNNHTTIVRLELNPSIVYNSHNF